jgi:hypothetical protein
MALTSGWYATGLQNALKGLVDLDLASNLKAALILSAYPLDQDLDEFFNTDVEGDETSGTGYTAGGEVVTTPAVSVVNDTAVSAWAASNAYNIGDLVRPLAGANGYVYRCVVAGTSGGSAPSWSLVIGDDTSDSGVTWDNVGTSFVKFDIADPGWGPGSTITARYMVVYVDGTPGSGDYLVAWLDYGQDETSTNGDFDVIIPADGLAQIGIS